MVLTIAQRRENFMSLLVAEKMSESA